MTCGLVCTFGFVGDSFSTRFAAADASRNDLCFLLGALPTLLAFEKLSDWYLVLLEPNILTVDEMLETSRNERQ